MPQTSVLKTTKPQSLDGLRTDDLVIPTQFYSDLLVAPIDDNTLGNELTVDPFMDKEEIRGEFLISVEQVCATSFNPGPHCASQICSRAAIRIVL